jgi:glycosyltransferase involved in cell wall biosynthesis
MLTIFTSPKPFTGHAGVIQRNAMLSWTRLYPRAEVILFGNDLGTAEVAERLGFIHVPDVKCTEFGTPLLSDMFQRAQEIGSNDLFCYINADIILFSDLTEQIARHRDAFGERFLLIGRRWNLDVTRPLAFRNIWEMELRQVVAARGVRHPPTGIDYFIYPRGQLATIPDFAIGRPGWDNWLIHHAEQEGFRIIDGTPSITTVHQNHDYAHVPQGSRNVWEGPEANRNRLIARALAPSFQERNYTIDNASWKLTRNGLRKNGGLRHAWWRLLTTTRIVYAQTAGVFRPRGRFVDTDGWRIMREDQRRSRLWRAWGQFIFAIKPVLFVAHWLVVKWLKARGRLAAPSKGEVPASPKAAGGSEDRHQVDALFADVASMPAEVARADTEHDGLLFSVVICTYNRADMLPPCLDSLCKQNFDRGNYEIIVVDNNSTDRTRQVVDGFAAHTSNLSYLFEPAQGLSHARNAGWRNARGRFVAYVDDECRMPANWLKVAADIVNAYDLHMFGGPYVSAFDGPKPDWFRPTYLSTYAFGAVRRTLGQSEYLSGGNMFIRRDLVRRHGGFRPDLGMTGERLGFGEEVALQRLIRIRETDPLIIIDPALVVTHLVRPEKTRILWLLRHRIQAARYAWYGKRIAAERLPVGSGSSSGAVGLAREVARLTSRAARLALYRVFVRNRALYPYWQNSYIEEILPLVTDVVRIGLDLTQGSSKTTTNQSAPGKARNNVSEEAQQ